jgi:menaquinone-9 beta-reductase
MSESRVDVLVIGGGPAGLVTAAALAGRGLTVVLVGPDEAGGHHDVLVSGPALRGLRSLGVPLRDERLVDTVELRVGTGRSRSMDGAPAMAIARARLLALLNDHARRAGVSRLTGMVRTVKSVSGGYRATVAAPAVGAGAAEPDGAAVGGFSSAAVHVTPSAVTPDVVAPQPVGPPTVTSDGAGSTAIAPSAVERGGAPLGGVSSGAVRVGVVREGDGGGVVVYARHVVVATGADGAGFVGSGAAVGCGGAAHTAGTAWARRFGGVELRDRWTLSLLPPAEGERQAAPACVWAVPGDGTVTVGVARIGAAIEPGWIEEVLAGQPMLAGAEPVGPAVSGALNTGFTPERVRNARGLLVGDAAGLVNPFTGEGISHAVQSGLLAADAIAAHPADAAAAQRQYAARLAGTFIGYFETARHAARRYRLMWRILESGADNDHPFFAKARRAVLMPEGLAELTAAETLGLAEPDTLVMAPFLFACDEVAIATIRDEWPFLARLVISGEGLGHQRLRPGVLFYAGLLAGGSAPDLGLATPAAAMELAMLGALAFLSPVAGRSAGRGIDWALASTVLAGDFLLSQASRLIAESVPEASWSFADWLAELTSLRSARLDDERAEPAEAVFAALFEYPARIGAELGGGGPRVVAALRDFGWHCGRVFLHAEDVLALRNERTRLDTTLAAMVGSRLSGIPAGKDLTDPGFRAAALRHSVAAGEEAWRAAIDTLGDGPASPLLRGFADAVAAPVLRQVMASG